MPLNRVLISSDARGNTYELQDSQAKVVGHVLEGALNLESDNFTTIAGRIDSNIQSMKNWLSNNPNGAVLTAQQTANLVRFVIGLAKLVRRDLVDVDGT